MTTDPSTFDAARIMIERGWRAIPVATGQKACHRKGWHQLNLAAADVSEYFIRNGNVAVVLGPVSGELVDIDLDCPEALELADIYLPPTQAEFGRASKPRSHRLYIAAGATFEVFSDPVLEGKNTLIELRAQGRDGGAHQTLFPPSVVDGERREWHGDVIAPAVVPTRALRKTVAWLAIGSLVFRYLSPTAARDPKPDLPDLLWEFDPALGRAAFSWLKQPNPDEQRRDFRPHHNLSRSERHFSEIVRAIPNDCGWEEWNAIGMAIFAVDNSEHGLILFDAFSAKSTKYDPYAVQERWRNYRRSPPNRTGFGKLVALARKHGWRAN